jgi:putative phage-type endonuclease
MTADERSKWLAERRTGIGGSDAAAVCGLSQWRTPLDVYLSKVGDVVDEENSNMRRGTILEPAVMQMYSDATGRTIEKPRDIIRSQTHPFALASLDGIASGMIVVDGKTARNRGGWGEPGTSEVPVDYLCQMQHYLAVTGYELAELAVLFGDFEFAIFPIPADAEFQEMMLDREAEFWDRVKELSPPDPANASDVVKRWPISFDKEVAATEAVAFAVDELRSVRHELAAIESRKEELEAAIKSFIADADTLTYSGKKLATWKTAKGRTSFNQAEFKLHHPEIYEAFLRSGNPSRRFLLKGE